MFVQIQLHGYDKIYSTNTQLLEIQEISKNINLLNTCLGIYYVARPILGTGIWQ